jgi:hypothetical protein
MVRRGFGHLLTWTAALVRGRGKVDDSQCAGGLSEMERVRDASARVAAQSDETIVVIIERGSFDVDIAPNRWTVLAADGLRGALFTSMVEVTPKGHIELTREVAAP